MKLRNQSLSLSRSILFAAAAALLAITQGCDSTSSNRTDADSSTARAEAAAKKAEADTNRIISDLDRTYVIGPTAATELNYRVVWQYENPRGTSLKGFALRGDSVYTLDQYNFLSRINISDGQRRWRVPAADEVLDVTSLNIVDEKAYLTAGSQMLVFDVVNGAPLAKWSLDRVAGTHPVEWGNHLIYGSRGGDLVWLRRNVGFIEKAYHISPTFRVPPVIRGNAIAVVGVQGEVALINAATATKFWDRTLLSPVSSRPVIGDEMVYIAGEDQYIWGLDIRNGRALWSYLTGTPLKSSPTLVDDRLYQQVPGIGLMCFNAIPDSDLDGEVYWQNEKVTGSVIMARRGELYAWDNEARRLFVLDETRGLTRTRVELPQAEFVTVGGENNEDLFAASADGRVVRISPRN